MSLKTEYGYNEDDFTERSGQLDELMVTITLSEYRNLIVTQTRLDAEVDRLQEEKAELEKKLKAASEALTACKKPEWIRAIGNVLAHWGEDQGDAGQEAEDAD